MTKAIRELLLRKTDNVNLRFLINTASDKVIENMIVESLEKMASYKEKKAVKMNSAVRDFINHAVGEVEAGEPNPMEHIRDAMGHHASHYAAARTANNKPLADEHAKQFLKLGHLANKIHSAAYTISNLEPEHDADYKTAVNSIANFDAPDLQAWQATSPEHFANPHKSSGVDLPGWRAYQKQDGVRTRGDGVSAPNKFSFDWLANSPNSGHRDFARHVVNNHHESGYPMEQVKINNKHIPVAEIESPGKFVSHPFDYHPIVQHFDESPEAHAENAEKYKNKLSMYHAGPHGLVNASKAQELSHPDHGKDPGFQIHPKESNLNKNIKNAVRSGIVSAALATSVNALGGTPNTTDPHQELNSKLSQMNVMGQYYGGGKNVNVLKEKEDTDKWDPSVSSVNTSFAYEHLDRNKAGTGWFVGPDAEKAKKLVYDFHMKHFGGK